MERKWVKRKKNDVNWKCPVCHDHTTESFESHSRRKLHSVRVLRGRLGMPGEQRLKVGGLPSDVLCFREGTCNHKYMQRKAVSTRHVGTVWKLELLFTHMEIPRHRSGKRWLVSRFKLFHTCQIHSCLSCVGWRRHIHMTKMMMIQFQTNLLIKNYLVEIFALYYGKL